MPAPQVLEHLHLNFLMHDKTRSHKTPAFLLQSQLIRLLIQGYSRERRAGAALHEMLKIISRLCLPEDENLVGSFFNSTLKSLKLSDGTLKGPKSPVLRAFFPSVMKC